MGISQAFGKAIADYTASLTNYIRLGSSSQYLTLPKSDSRVSIKTSKGTLDIAVRLRGLDEDVQQLLPFTINHFWLLDDQSEVLLDYEISEFTIYLGSDIALKIIIPVRWS